MSAVHNTDVHLKDRLVQSFSEPILMLSHCFWIKRLQIIETVGRVLQRCSTIFGEKYFARSNQSTRTILIPVTRTMTVSAIDAASTGEGERNCFDVCLVRPRGELYVRWQEQGHQDEEAVLCMNCDTSYPVPQYTRWTGVFYRILSSQRQLSV
jgi:hypothetical protein